MRKFLFALLASLGVWLAFGGQAHAQSGCTPRSQAFNLNGFRDGQPANSITEQAFRDVWCSTGWNVVVPSGDLATDTAALTAAFATADTKHVWLEVGSFNVCSQLTLPSNSVVKGAVGNNWFYFGGVLPPTNIRCNGTSSFSSGQSFIVVGDWSYLEGFAVVGMAWPTPGNSANVSCFDVSNKFYVTFDNMYGIRCKNGIKADSQGTADATHGHVEGIWVKGGGYLGNDNHGFTSSVTNSGFMSDSRFDSYANFCCNASAGLYFEYLAGTHFTIRTEDHINGSALPGLTPPYGLDIVGGAGIINIVGSIFDRNAAANLHLCGIDGGGGGVTVTGNTFSFPGWQQGNTGTSRHVEFCGSNFNVQFSGNSYNVSNGTETTYANYVYKCTSCTFTGGAGFYENPPAGLNGIYFDELTRYAMQPYVAALAVKNYLVGGDGMAAVWAATASTLATAALASPTGVLPQAASVTENNANSQHYVQQNASPYGLADSTVYTMSCYIKNKTGSRNVAIAAGNNGGFANYVQLVVNPVANTIATSNAAGTSSILKSAITDLGGGWSYATMTFTTGAGSFTSPTYQIAAFSGTTGNYTGDNASGFYVWGCKTSLGYPTAP